MIRTPMEYMAYLVRIWPVRNTKGMGWRAFITNAQTGEDRGFASLEELFNFLEVEVCQRTLGDSKPGKGRKGDGIEG